ncbi:MAG: type II secretion system F family protein [Sphingomonadaceae bacterium]|nr:type II secretion system F family protein [Sphingomonadaceae bacterium]
MELDELMAPFLIFGLGLAGVVALLAMMVLGPSSRKAQERRLLAIKGRHGDVLAAAAETQLRRVLANRRESRLEEFAAQYIPRPDMLRRRIAQTGKSWTLGQYGIVSLAILAVVFVLLYLRGAPLLLALLAGVFAGLFIPHVIVGRAIKKRIKKFNARFPEAIELLVRGLRAGLPISETLAVVAHEIPGPVGVEFQSVVDKMRIGRTMDEALDETTRRLDTPEFKFFIITLAIQRETGGNLAETLSNLATVLRQRGQMKLKIRAMSSESKASAYIVGSLPFFVFGIVWFMNPGYMDDFFMDERLMVAGIGGLVWMGIGIFVMAKMVSFEI